MGKKKENEERYDREALLRERKKITYNLVLLLAASFAVLVGTLTMAWFAMNEKTNGTSMSVTVAAQEGVEISLGSKNGNFLVAGVNEVNAPTQQTDWSAQVDVSDYYCFGRLIPASSNDGSHILFTPNAVREGRHLASSYSFYVADGKTDGNLKQHLELLTNSADDTDSLMATAHVLTSANDDWNSDDYRGSTVWYETNDDGYYVDIPIWFRTSIKSGVDYDGTEYIPLKVEGYVEPGTGSQNSEVLFQAVRVVILDENKDIAMTDNIIPLKDGSYSSDTTILDSKNYTVHRNTSGSSEIQADDLYGWAIDNVAAWIVDGSGIEPACSPVEYSGYDSQDPIVKLPVPTSGQSWGATTKVYLRIWLDGEDEQCYNPMAGQNWIIHLKFSIMETS